MQAPLLGSPSTPLGPMTFSTFTQNLLERQTFPGAQQKVTSAVSLQGTYSSATPPLGKKHGFCAARQVDVRVQRMIKKIKFGSEMPPVAENTDLDIFAQHRAEADANH